MMGPRNVYIATYGKPIGENLYEVRVPDVNGTLYGVRQYNEPLRIYVIPDERELRQIFDMFEPLTVATTSRQCSICAVRSIGFLRVARQTDANRRNVSLRARIRTNAVPDSKFYRLAIFEGSWIYPERYPGLQRQRSGRGRAREALSAAEFMPVDFR